MKIMCIDYGMARIGCAISDELGMIASPVGTVHEKYYPAQLEKVAQIVAQKKPEKIVVGLPKNMDGTEGSSAQLAREFAAALTEKTGVETLMVDERLSTVSAHRALSDSNVRGSGKRKKVVDTVSAVIILQGYLDAQG